MLVRCDINSLYPALGSMNLCLLLGEWWVCGGEPWINLLAGLTYRVRGRIGREWQNAVSSRAGWHHQSWYNQSSGCKRANQSRAEGAGLCQPSEVMHTAVSPAWSAWGGFERILGGPLDMASSPWCLDGQCWWDWSAVAAEACEQNAEWRQTKAPATANDLHGLHRKTESEQDKS